MDAEGNWKLRVSTPSLILAIGAFLLLLAPAILQYQWAQQRRAATKASERRARLAAIRTGAEARRTRLEQQAGAVKKDDRVRQLYQEIDNLSRASDRVREWSSRSTAPAPRGTRAGEK